MNTGTFLSMYYAALAVYKYMYYANMIIYHIIVRKYRNTPAVS